LNSDQFVGLVTSYVRDRFYRIGPRLKCHVASHNGELPHKCQKCGKGFLARNKLERHMATHEYR
jgi:hypothetical protein